ncbi:glycosyltransferase [Azospirillum sp. sgz301742]
MIALRRVTAVLACHNRRDLTLRCLGTLFEQRFPNGAAVDLRAVLVDDGSSDGTADAVAKRFPEVCILRGDGTLWWAGAMEMGLRAAMADGADLLLWLNDDVALDETALASLLDAHDRWSAAEGCQPVVVGATRAPDGGGRSYGGQRRGRWHPFRLHPVHAVGEAQRCDTFQGNVVLVPCSAAQDLGGIDPVFIGVQGMADTDFGLRATARGIPVVAVPPVGACASNTVPAPWCDGGRPLTERLSAIVGPRGLPPRAWLSFARRHGGGLWPLWAALPYVHAARRALAPSAAPPSAMLPPARPRVALFDGITPRYRLPLVERLASEPRFAFTVFHGRGLAGWNAADVQEALPLPEMRVRNRFWPGGGGRIAWTGGALSVLVGRYDAVIAGFHVHDLAIWSLWLARRLFGRPRLLLSGHFDLQPGGGAVCRLRHWLRVRMAQRADAVLPYTPRGASNCLASGIPANRVFVSHNSLDVLAIRAAAAGIGPQAEEEARRRHGLHGLNVFLFVGRLYPAKRVDLAIAAVRALRQAGRPCVLLVVGDGPDRARLEAMAGDGAVRLLGALFDDADLATLFRLAVAMVLPDAVGLAVVHAFAHGVPLVTCRGGTAHGPEIDYLRDGENGLLADAPDAAALAAALASLLDRPERLAALRREAHRTADTMGVDAAAKAMGAALTRALDAAHG